MNIRAWGAAFHRLGQVCLVVVTFIAIITVAQATPARAHQPAPSPSPSSAGDPRCAQQAQPGRIAWCFPWITRVDGQPADLTWQTVCSNARTFDEHAACDAASVTLKSPPDDYTRSVLVDQPAGQEVRIRCDLFLREAERNTPDEAQWREKAARCDRLDATFRAQLFNPGAPSSQRCNATDVACRVEQAAAGAVENSISFGIQGLIDLAVQATGYLLSQLAKLVFATTSIASPDAAFYNVYNSAAGILLILVFLFYLFSTIINGLRPGGPTPLSSLFGLGRAVFGMTFAAGVAWTMVALWDEATNALIDRNAAQEWDPSVWVHALTALSGGAATGLLALFISLFAIVGLILLFVMMLFRGELVTVGALFGAMAMAGQAYEPARAWGRRWFWTINALASSKFFVALIWIYATRAAYESDLLTALKALLLIWLMVLVPYILLRMTSIMDAYLSDVDPRGLAMAAAGGATQIGTSIGGAAERIAGSGPGIDPTTLLGAANDAIPTSPYPRDGIPGVTDTTTTEAVNAAQQGQDGGAVGEPTTGPGDSQQTSDGQAQRDEADGVQAGTDSAKHDVTAGELTAPGDATGDGPAIAPPQTEPPAATPAGGVNPAAIGPDTSPDVADAGETGSSAGTGADPFPPAPDAHPTGQSHAAADSADRTTASPSSSGPATPAGGAGAGGAAGAAEVPIIPA